MQSKLPLAKNPYLSPKSTQLTHLQHRFSRGNFTPSFRFNMATPQVPPRPNRSQHAVTEPIAAPHIPPRPAARMKERSVSPTRYAPSPLNILPRKASVPGLQVSAADSRSASSVDAPPRPPSVKLPSIGQEGDEYAGFDLPKQENSALEQALSDKNATTTSHVHSELPLHAPRPSLSQSGARAQVAAVTRSGSGQSPAPGISAAVSPRDDHDPYSRPLKSKTSSTVIRSQSSLSHDRPGSASLEGVGIPQIGQHVPMFPNAGDVQAPSPALIPHIEGTEPRPRHHGRKHSGREVFHGPPGSYGLHGHGVTNADQFEKSWYAKHPDELAKEEHGHYSPALSGNRPEWALSSDDLNKIVHGTGKVPGSGEYSLYLFQLNTDCQLLPQTS